MKTIIEPSGRTSSVDYSSVTPATGTSETNFPIGDSFANGMPTADVPAVELSSRAHPDKVIPGAEARTGVDQAEEERTRMNSV